MQPGDVEITYADTEPLERDFGFRPSTPLREGLRRWGRDNIILTSKTYAYERQAALDAVDEAVYKGLRVPKPLEEFGWSCKTVLYKQEDAIRNQEKLIEDQKAYLAAANNEIVTLRKLV